MFSVQHAKHFLRPSQHERTSKAPCKWSLVMANSSDRIGSAVNVTRSEDQSIENAETVIGPQDLAISNQIDMEPGNMSLS